MRQFFHAILFTVLLCLNVLSENVPVTLAWDKNPEPDIDHYVLHIGTSKEQLTQIIQVTGGAVEKEVQLPVGVIHYATCTAVNTSGLESEPSNLLVFQVFRPGEGVAPSPPILLRKTASIRVSVQRSSDLKVWAEDYAYTAAVNGESEFWRLTIALR